MCLSPFAEKTTLPQPPLDSCSQEAEHVYDTIPANTPHFYGVLEGPTLESDYHGVEDDSEGDEDACDKLQKCQDVFEVREKHNLFVWFVSWLLKSKVICYQLELGRHFD